MAQNGKIVFGIVGSGWRAEMYLQIAALMPDRFEVCGVVSRSETKLTELRNRWKVRGFLSGDELLAQTGPDFMLIAVAKDAGAGVIKEYIAKGIPVLAETPPANDLQRLRDLYETVGPGAKLQIAEQFPLQPMHRARLAVARSGKLGEIHYAHVSINHSYHGVSLIRKALGIGFENARINAFAFEAPGVEGPGRNGPPGAERIVANQHTLATLDFGAKVGLYDFEKNQHRSWARSQRILIRGVRGELHQNSVKYLLDYRTPIEFALQRLDAGLDGNLEGYHLKGIIGEGEWLYTNPFAPARLSDEEIALATCLAKMKQYVDTGAAFYNLAEAAQDQYLALLIEESAAQKRPIETSTQIWAG
jgi:predicted dehydrogenase